ncbi:sensor histidine kinase [Parabacteroides pacaensis]|uniref:sensor histidine kinase n=1 Tax=Parabacteroides pacaensis TaxID=2086575 RepID=UPI000D0F925F|nr:HAMP domain-containing sensor histidine kinase [Parabacteroides pacaensis]
MYSKRIYLEILIHIILIVTLATCALLLIIFRYAIILGSIGLVFVMFQISWLANHLNTANRRIKLFFDAIENGESTLVFPEINLSKEQILLNKAFNRINRLLIETKHQSQQKEHFYKALLEHVPGGIISWDDSGTIQTANKAALSLLGLSTLLHRSQLEQIDPGFSALFEEAVSKGNAIMKVNREWEKRQLVIGVNKIVLGDKTLTLLSLQDIDENLNSKENEAWERLTHVLTHEIMNSVAPIVSLSSTLTSYFESQGIPKHANELSDKTVEKTLRGLEVMKSQSSNLIHFTHSYRKLSFLQTPSIKLYNLTAQFFLLKELFTPELNKKGIKLTIQTRPSILHIRGDENLLFQVFQNLIKNAIQALQNTRHPLITVSASLSDYLFIEIKDNGPGIPLDIQENIFVPFFTTKENGSGIGLSLSKQIIRRHRGQLYVKSAWNEGTNFFIRLPL